MATCATPHPTDIRQSPAAGRRYSLTPLAVEYREIWYLAHFNESASPYGRMLIPDDELLPIEACVWVELTLAAAR